jgi:hypothetical protein
MVNYYIAALKLLPTKESMKANKIMGLRLLISIMIVIGFSSCSKKSSSKNTSRATGWNMDSKKAGSNKKQQAGPGLVFVEVFLYG